MFILVLRRFASLQVSLQILEVAVEHRDELFVPLAGVEQRPDEIVAAELGDRRPLGPKTLKLGAAADLSELRLFVQHEEHRISREAILKQRIQENGGHKVR